MRKNYIGFLALASIVAGFSGQAKAMSGGNPVAVHASKDKAAPGNTQVAVSRELKRNYNGRAGYGYAPAPKVNQRQKRKHLRQCPHLRGGKRGYGLKRK